MFYKFQIVQVHRVISMRRKILQSARYMPWRSCVDVHDDQLMHLSKIETFSIVTADFILTNRETVTSIRLKWGRSRLHCTFSDFDEKIYPKNVNLIEMQIQNIFTQTRNYAANISIALNSEWGGLKKSSITRFQKNRWCWQLKKKSFSAKTFLF